MNIHFICTSDTEYDANSEKQALVRVHLICTLLLLLKSVSPILLLQLGKVLISIICSRGERAGQQGNSLHPP